MFRNNRIVGLEEHSEWFQNSLANPSRKIFIGEILNKKIGICRFDQKNSKNCAEISINLNPAMRGKNLGYIFLKNSMLLYQEDKPTNLLAEIRKDNIASIKIFEKCGFVVESSKDEFISYKCKIKLTTSE